MTEAKKIFETYGKALKQGRKQLNKKQGELALDIGVNQSEVSRWENSDSVPLEHNRNKIEQVLKIIITPVKDGWELKDQLRSQASGVQEPLSDYNLNLGLDKVSLIEQLASDEKAEQLPLDDPLKLIESAELLLRLARLALDKK